VDDASFDPPFDQTPVSPDDAGVGAPADPLQPAPRAGRDMRLAYLIAAFGALVACTQVGGIIFPTLLKDGRSPELLIALTARMRFLLLAVPAGVNPIAYAIIGFLRLSAAAWVCYGLGYYYGDRGVAWLERQVQGDTPATFRWLQRAADKIGPIVTFLMPGSNIVCVLVGQRKMPKERFAIFISAGIVFRLIWLWIAAKIFEDELKKILKFIDKYQWWLVAAFFIITIVQGAYKASKNPPPPKRAAG
jgi:membrane protein DedA with SNARE-associated domain